MIKRAHLRLGSRKWNPTIYKGGTEYKAVNIYGNYAEYVDSGKPRIPSGYTLVPYIESNRNVSGSIAPYINTGLYADKTTRVVCDLTFPSSNSIHPRFWSSGQIYTYCSSVSLENTNKIRVKNFSGTSWPNASSNSNYNNVFANKRLLIDYNPYKALYIEYDRIIVNNNITGGDPLTSPGHIILNWASESTAGGDPDYVGTDMNGYGAFKHHEWQIYTGGELVSHLYPVTRNSDSEPGLYDTVRKIFLASPRGHFTAGTGEWTPHVRTKIGSNEFYGETFTSYDIPKTVTSIGNYAFRFCRNLESMTIPDSVTGIGHGVFDYCSGLTSIIIPNSVTSIGDYAFSNCSALTSVIIPNRVTRIGAYMFNNCSALTSVIIPNSVTSIGNNAFDGVSLTSVNIPSSVTSIENSAFQRANNLKTFIIRGTSTSIGTNMFINYDSSMKIYVPYSADHSVLNWYKTATNWSNYADRIYELNSDGSVPSE